MQIRPQLQIQTMVKAMADVVLPAVDANNKLAQEQARLIMGTLALMARQLPLQFAFDCDELRRLLKVCSQLRVDAHGGERTTGALATLAATVESAAAVLERAKAGPDEVEQAVRALRAATGTLVTEVYADGTHAAQVRVRQTVLEMSQEQLLRDRAMLITQGWEPDPAAVPAIETLLGLSPPA